jgi:hypothetical protein
VEYSFRDKQQGLLDRKEKTAGWTEIGFVEGIGTSTVRRSIVLRIINRIKE